MHYTCPSSICFARNTIHIMLNIACSSLNVHNVLRQWPSPSWILTSTRNLIEWGCIFNFKLDYLLQFLPFNKFSFEWSLKTILNIFLVEIWVLVELLNSRLVDLSRSEWGFEDFIFWLNYQKLIRKYKFQQLSESRSNWWNWKFRVKIDFNQFRRKHDLFSLKFIYFYFWHELRCSAHWLGLCNLGFWNRI